MSRDWRGIALRASAFLVVYLGTTTLLHGSYAFSQAVLWLPTGVAIAGLWLLGPAYWPVVTLGTLAHRLLSHYTFPSFLFGTVGNTLEALTAVWLLHRLGFSRDFRRLRDGVAVLVIAVVAPVVGATIGRTRFLLRPDEISFFDGWWGWWRMNALGVLVVVPLVLSWSDLRRLKPRLGTLLEILGLAAAVLALSWFLTTIDPGNDQSGMVLSYLALPLALYAAVRFGVRGASAASAGLIVLLTFATANGIGPFVAPPSLTSPSHVRELALQAVIAILATTPLILGAVMADRESALRHLAIERERHQDLISSINRNVNEGLFRNSYEHGLVYANTALARMLGYARPEELEGAQLHGMFADPARESELRELIASQGHFLNEEVLFVRRDGSLLPAFVSCTGLSGPDGRIQFCDGAVSDMTARKRLEDQLRQTQKMEALGMLAGGVAHDFNNLLTAIGGYAETLRSALPEGTPARADAEEITRASTRAAGLTRQLLAYTRRQKLDPQVLDLRDVVDQLGALLRRLIGEDIHLVTHHRSTGALVRVDRGQLEQVIINLVVNARDAMPEGGTLTVATGPVDEEQALAHAHAEPVQGPLVRLSVSDTGVGMDGEVLTRAFDPFFTTKAPGRGTGLGLSTVHGIVRQSGGVVWIESAPGDGTTVHVCLPLMIERPAAAQPPGASPATARHGGTVLVVEDEAMVRDLISRTLRRDGFTVLEAEDGEHGIEVARRAGALDLVVTDVVMPRLGGREMAARLMAERPGLRVLFVSGYSGQNARGGADLEPERDLLMKPFTPSTLLDRVHACIATARPGALTSYGPGARRPRPDGEPAVPGAKGGPPA